MTLFIFEIDIKLKLTLGEREIEVENEFARLALSRRIAGGMNVNETIKIVSVKKK